MGNDFIKIEEAFKKAPTKVKNALLSAELSETLLKIMEENKVSDENKNKVTDETGAVLLGLSSRELMATSIEKNTGMMKEVVSNISKEIEEKIFKNVLEDNQQQETQRAKHEAYNTGKEIVLEEHNPFLPMLSKQPTTDNLQPTTNNRQFGNRQETILTSEVGTPTRSVGAYSRQQDKEEEKKKTEVTSALAAEVGGLLSKTNNQRPTTNNLQPEVQKLTTNNEQRTTEENREKLATTMPKPEDKLTGVVQVPRVEVEMVKRDQQLTTDNKQQEKKGDPYREAVE